MSCTTVERPDLEIPTSSHAPNQAVESRIERHQELCRLGLVANSPERSGLRELECRGLLALSPRKKASERELSGRFM
jgi:hypothetical protein